MRRGERTVALWLGSLRSLKVSYDILCSELSKVCSIVKAKRGEISGAELQKQFGHSPLAGVADEHDWDDWADGFSPKNPQRGRPKGAALTFLESKMPIKRATIKSYLSRAKKLPKRGKQLLSTAINSHQLKSTKFVRTA